jgi:hypothetical protein
VTLARGQDTRQKTARQQRKRRRRKSTRGSTRSESGGGGAERIRSQEVCLKLWLLERLGSENAASHPLAVPMGDAFPSCSRQLWELEGKKQLPE